jgi:hypothetical protein
MQSKTNKASLQAQEMSNAFMKNAWQYLMAPYKES